MSLAVCVSLSPTKPENLDTSLHGVLTTQVSLYFGWKPHNDMDVDVHTSVMQVHWHLHGYIVEQSRYIIQLAVTYQKIFLNVFLPYIYFMQMNGSSTNWTCMLQYLNVI